MQKPKIQSIQRFPGDASGLRSSIQQLRANGMGRLADTLQDVSNIIHVTGNITGASGVALDATYVEECMVDAMAIITKRLQTGADIRSRTGKLLHSMDPIYDTKKTYGMIFPAATNRKVNYGAVLEEGIKTYVVTPKNKKCLRFIVDGKEVFTKKATIKIPAKKWISNAAEEVQDRWDSQAARIARSWMGSNVKQGKDIVGITIR